MAPQQEKKKPKDDQEAQRPREQGQSGIKKFFPDRKDEQKDDIKKLEKGLVTMEPDKAKAVLEQAVISDKTGRTTSHNDQSSQANHNAPEKDANHPPPPPVISEPRDIEMQELGPQKSTESQSRQREHVAIPPKREDTPHLAPPVGDDMLKTTQNPSVQYDEGCLAVLTPKRKGPKQHTGSGAKEDDEDVDIVAWGTLNRSSFIIIQEGPFATAQYRFERRKGYSHPEKACISDAAEQISWLKDKDSSGKRVSRYTRENIVGIYGIVCSNGKRKCTWMMIKWKDLKEEDAKKLKRGCSWEPKSDLDRFFSNKKEAEEKRLEFDSLGRHIDERSPTPCPIEETIDQHRKRRGTDQGRDAAEAKDEVSASRKQATNLQPGNSAIKSEEEFMQQGMQGPEWEKLSDLEKEARKVKLVALWDIYREEVEKSGKASGKIAE
ncbi:hypothetical protein N7450_011760 [Penicillium hetheringtonii]|uniref:Uncharacterized protein n=1 Tax=Penicillium hetheringtonii TaxID=911720 RepID=A0AAD6DAH9_9EURO|nr:hypothetical protein N7450_011760 [Penicillium hetheringtonii]